MSSGAETGTPIRNAPAGGLLAAREAAAAILEASGALLPGWRVRGIKRSGDRTVVLDVGPEGGTGIALEWTEPGGEEVKAFLTGDVYAVGYRTAPGAFDLDASETPSDVKRLAAQACQALARSDRRVTLCAVDAGPEPASLRTIEFTAAAVEGWLRPALSVGQELAMDYRLAEVHPHGADELALAFQRPGDSHEPRLRLRPRDDARPAAFRTRSLDVTYKLVFGDATEGGRAGAHARLAEELALRLEGLDRGVRFVHPQPEAKEAGEVAAGDAAAAPPEAMNLAIPAPCHSACGFCSIREEIYPILDANAPFVRQLKADIVRSGQRGTKVLRINGIEPLNAPYLFELLGLAREVGFDEFHLHSTCRPLADPAFCDRYLDAMPAKHRIYVPIYGASPEVHDRVTGAPGSFDEVMAAVRNVRERADERAVLLFTTVVMRQNAADLVAIRDLVRPLGRWWEVHLPFPNTSSRTDRYRDVSLPMSEALERIYPDGWWPLADLPLGEVLPCVALAHQRRTGHALLTSKRVAERVREPAGTFYRTAGFEHSLGAGRATAFSAATVPCPHAAGCALSAVCPKQMYALYAEQYGMDELAPVSREELLALPDGEAIVRAVEETTRA